MVTFDDAKRQANLQKHDIDLAACEGVFDAPMLTIEDAGEDYGEQRLKSLCWLHGRVAVLVWTDRETGPHLISCRYGGNTHHTWIFSRDARLPHPMTALLLLAIEPAITRRSALSSGT